MAYLRGDTSTLDSFKGGLAAPGLKPHIIPDILYPSYVASGTSNKLLDGSTSHSGAFGTAQSDGRKYYYTNIAGSRKIKDPRIGAHFGSQRHIFRSIQILEQESAMSAFKIYSIDGRNWCRMSWGQSDNNKMYNTSNGMYLQFDTGQSDNTDWIEVTGYFSSLNILCNTDNNQENFNVIIDGTANSSVNALAVVQTHPLGARYVTASSLHNVVFDATPTLGIHTVKIGNDAGYFALTGIELIIQDITSTATKSKIQIPAQNVVSYGKKFAIGPTAHHYNPFAFKTDGTTAWTSGNHNGTAWPVIDTATSLGLAAWLHSSNYYYPYNGGRVVVWVDSSGAIKTSVNMMPPNAQNLVNSAITAKANASVANDTYLPTFSGTLTHSQAEVAKKFHFREFGNGAANGGAAATYADASMVHAADDIAYVMDDGSTSLSADESHKTPATGENDLYVPAEDHIYLTFIGTGLTLENTNDGPGIDNHVQNLSYGSHQFRITRAAGGGSAAHALYMIDGVSLGAQGNLGNYGGVNEITIHQPKMPPIPENAIVIADYMLMADFVKQTGTAGDIETQISKGVRYVSGSRDHFGDGAGAFLSPNCVPHGQVIGLSLVSGSGDNTAKLPFFGTTAAFHLTHSNQAWPATLNGSAATETKLDNTGTLGHFHDAMTIAESAILGNNNVQVTIPGGQYYLNATTVVSPIHTSSHYQPFEGPFTYDLLGGDRNMEQTNLVVTADGKTWDEVTRDTSYIGNLVVNCQESADFSGGTIVPFTDWRGVIHGEAMVQKDFCIGYEDITCMKAGSYKIICISLSRTTNEDLVMILVNGAIEAKGYAGLSGFTQSHISCIVHMVRGDRVQIKGGYSGSASGGSGNKFIILRLPDLKSIKDNKSTQSTRASTALARPSPY